MRIFYSSKDAPRSLKRPVLTLGNFDGVHLAHQKMFQLAIREAKKLKGKAVVYTFEPHPVKVLSKESAPLMINTLAQKLELIRKTKMAAVVVEPFDLKFAHLGAREWFQRVVVENLRASGVVAGYDFTFGQHRSGTVELLETLCLQVGIRYKILEAQMLGETLISSSQIRHFIARGEMERAAALLGRNYFIDGEVIQGAGRGAQIGIRTANLKTENELIPLNGVYACFVQRGLRRYRAVTNIGMNPTFGGKALSIEAHLLRFNKEIYGKNLRLHFVKRIRDERTFPSVEKLVEQIRCDIEAAKRIH